MKKIIVYGMTTNYGGGIEEVVINLLRNRNKDFSYVYVIPGEHTEYEQEIRNMGGEVIYISPKNNFFNNIKDFYKVLKNSEKNSTVYFNAGALFYAFPYFIAYILRFEKIVIHAHNGKNTERKKWEYGLHYINRFLINKMNCVRISCSDKATEWIFGKKYVGTSNVKVIHNGVDIKRFRYDEAVRREWRKKLGIENEYLVGMIGRLVYQKNPLFLIEIIKELSNIDKNYKLIIIGEGVLREKLEIKIQEYGLKDKIIMFGSTNKAHEMFSTMDAFLLPSFYEGYPIVLVEAQVSGIPIACSDYITKEVNISGEIEYLPIDSPKAWVEWLMKKKNRKQIECTDLYCVQKMVQNIEEYLS